eukprot:gnl/TRDRNA2_/TRDRNA2_130367_c0_seq1.p1 gnl/TRDRNA2_/TRDRNA2_130367_c0~~gnl/TRDRNA2_/TRDRNA2_130367_c0_seq1.p1  ORF type:complete len:609 (+),score=64.61 gnl/TRDRNA2_/TRDRNA2_130367_c0_seq1:41-1867(+)
MAPAQPGSLLGLPGGTPPDAIIISGPDFYKPHIVNLYGGYKRTKNLYSKATYQKDPDQGNSGPHEAYIYWSAVDSRWCIGTELGATIGEVRPQDVYVFNPVPIYQGTEDDSLYPRLIGPWVVNLQGCGTRYQVDHMVTFEALELPPEAADPARDLGGYMHICSRKFVDYEFPPKVTSIEGDPPPVRFSFSTSQNRHPPAAATWVAASIVSGHATGSLFSESEIPPGGWCEGVQVHNAGLGPIFSALCEFPGHMESLFRLNTMVNPIGCYHIWLYDIWQHQWRRITVDEYIPTVPDPQAGGAPTPWAGGHGRALWACLLEKALAKLCGSYAALHRSEPGPILMALTGEQANISRWARDGVWWSRWRFLNPDRKSLAAPSNDAQPGVHRRVRGSQPLLCPMDRVAGTWHQNHEIFAHMSDLHRDNALLILYTDAGMDYAGERHPGKHDPSRSGLVFGHGYSLLQLVDVKEEGILLVQLRNIWGADAHWCGPWSESSPEWDKFPEVRRHYLRQEHRGSVEHSRFWMSWPDVCTVFDRIEVCPMPSAARKGSHVVPKKRSLASRSGARRTRGLSRKTSGFDPLSPGSYLPLGLFEWHCCESVERGDTERSQA